MRADVPWRCFTITALARSRQSGKLFAEIAPRSAARNGGYTRVVKLGPRSSDSAPMAFIEWVDLTTGDQTTSNEDAKSSKKAAQVFGRGDQKASRRNKRLTDHRERRTVRPFSN